MIAGKERQMKKCSNCGKVFENDDKFCDQCGALLPDETEETVKQSQSGILKIVNIALGAVFVFVVAFALFTNFIKNDSKEYLNNDYKKLCKTIKDSGIELSDDNNQKMDEIKKQMEDIDSCDEKKLKENIDSMNTTMTALKQYNDELKDYKGKIEAIDKEVQKNDLTSECSGYSGNCNDAVEELSSYISQNDVSKVKKASKNVAENIEKYTAGKDNYTYWKECSNSINEIGETASGKDISSHEDISTKAYTAGEALNDYENALYDGEDIEIKDTKSKLKTALQEYKDIVNKTKPEKKVVYEYLPGVQDSTDDSDDESDSSGMFLVSNSDSLLISTDSTEGWLSDFGATDRERACWYTLAINEISARYGAEFSSPSLKTYFANRSWYRDLGYDPNDIAKVFSSVEKKNFANFGKIRNKYCKKLGIKASAYSFSADEFESVLDKFLY